MMDCRRSWAVDEDRSRRWVVDDDRYPRRWAVDDDRSRIAFYQTQVKTSLDRIDKKLSSIRRMRMSATIPASSSSLLSSTSRNRKLIRNQPAVTDDHPPLQLPLRWRDPPPDRTIRNHPVAVFRDSPPLKHAIYQSDLLARPVSRVTACSYPSRHLEPVEQAFDLQSRIEHNLAVPTEKDEQGVCDLEPDEATATTIVNSTSTQLIGSLLAHDLTSAHVRPTELPAPLPLCSRDLAPGIESNLSRPDSSSSSHDQSYDLKPFQCNFDTDTTLSSLPLCFDNPMPDLTLTCDLHLRSSTTDCELQQGSDAIKQFCEENNISDEILVECGDAPVLFGLDAPECIVSTTRRASSQFRHIELIDLRDGRNAYVESTRITTTNVHHFIPSVISESIMDQQFVVGTVGQAFCSTVHDELSDHYKLLTVLELQSANPIPSARSYFGGNPRNYLSQRQLSIGLAELMVRMRPITLLVDGCQELRGGAMAGAIYAHAQHGDPLVQEFMGWLLRRVCSPLFEMRIPRTGKSINFLRVCCEDSGWAEAAAEAATHVGAATRRGGLGYGEPNALGALAVEAAKRIDRHLMDVINKRLKVRMMDHGDGETELNDNYYVGIEDVFIVGVQMIDVQSTDKAYPMQRTQAVRRNVIEAWNPKFVGPEDGKLIAVKRLSSSSYEKYNNVLFGRGSLLKAVATNIENKIFDPGESLSPSERRTSTESRSFDAMGE